MQKQATAALAAAWAAEVAPRVCAVKGDPNGLYLEQYVHMLRDADAVDDLTTLLYLVIDESRVTSLANPWGPSELTQGPRFELGRSLKWLIRDAQVAAAPYPIQRESIPERFVVLADEIALELDDRLRWFRDGGFLHGLLTDRQLAALARVDDWFGSFSGEANARLWTEEAMQFEPEWAHARQLSAEALLVFGVEVPRSESSA